jgi:TRAP-type uncharacterized transport system substrate-binding protein
MSNPSRNPFDLAGYLPKSAPEPPAAEWHSVENDGAGYLRYWPIWARETAQLHGVKRAACLAVAILANVLVVMTLRTGLVAPAHAQTVPKSLERVGTDAALKQRTNAWTVGVAGGQRSGTYMSLADELAQVLDDGDNLRVIPIVTYGAASNLDDLLYLRHVDAVMTQSDIFEYFRTQRKTPNLENRIHYITRLPLSEIHLLARTDIKSIEDLRGKKVSFGPAGAASSLTGTIIFQRLGVNVEQVLLDNPTALQKLKSGELAALVRVIGKPVDFFAHIPANSGLHLVPIPFSKIFADHYAMGEFTSQEYPTLVPQGQKIDTIAVPAVLAVFNWPKNTDRYWRVRRFTEALFTKWDKFHEPHRHPKWRDVNLAATVPGWTRWSVAEEMLRRKHQKNQSPAVSNLTQEQREALFHELLTWQEQRGSAQQQRSSVPQQQSGAQQQRRNVPEQRSVPQQGSSAQQQRSSVPQQRSTAQQQRSTAQQQRSTAQQQRSSVQQQGRGGVPQYVQGQGPRGPNAQFLQDYAEYQYASGAQMCMTHAGTCRLALPTARGSRCGCPSAYGVAWGEAR